MILEKIKKMSDEEFLTLIKNTMDDEKKLKQDVLKLKRAFDDMSENDFSMLGSVVNFIMENEIDTEWIKSSDTLSIADSLIKLNATSLLMECESLHDETISYGDDKIDLGHSKSM